MSMVFFFLGLGILCAAVLVLDWRRQKKIFRVFRAESMAQLSHITDVIYSCETEQQVDSAVRWGKRLIDAHKEKYLNGGWGDSSTTLKILREARKFESMIDFCASIQLEKIMDKFKLLAHLQVNG